MIPSERRARILHELELRGNFGTANFVHRTGVSGMTVRRDLEELERQGLLERVHGGAIPPLSARALQQRADARTPSRPSVGIGMVVPSASYYYPRVIAGAQMAAAELGIRLVLAASEYSGDRERRQIERMCVGRLDGLVVTPAQTFDEDEQTYRLIADVDVAVVLAERRISTIAGDLPLPSVSSDHERGAALAVQHLVRLGHRNIALASRPSPTAAPVRAGFARAMSALAPDGRRVEAPIAERAADADVAQRMLDDVLDRCLDADVTAIIVLPDDAAVSLLELAEDRSIAVPEQLSVVAYDDEIAALAAVPLTAIAPPKTDVGYRSVRACYEQLVAEQRASTRAIVHMNLTPTLVRRESTAEL